MRAEFAASLQRKLAICALAALAGLLFLFALGFALVACAIELARYYPPALAALFVAGGLLVVALLVLLAMLIVKSRPVEPSPGAKIARAAAPLALHAGLRSVVARPKLVPIVIVAGIVIGAMLGGRRDDR